MRTRVVNALKERHDVYIGRPGRGLAGPFGNPFKVGRDGTREECIEKFRAYFYRRLDEEPEFKKAVLDLKGKVLGCFCHPLPCHGDVIVQFLEDQSWNHWDEPKVAEYIDRYWRTNEGEIRHRRKILEKISGEMKKGDRVLEVGCGSGHVYKCLKDLAEVQYAGIDHSEEMIRLARKNHPEGEFSVGDGYRIGFPEGSFDAVLAIDVLQHVPDIVGILREMVRVTRRLVVFTLSGAIKSRSGEEIILGQKFLWNWYSKEDAMEKVAQASGGLPEKIEPIGDGTGCVLWILTKSGPTPGPR